MSRSPLHAAEKAGRPYGTLAELYRHARPSYPGSALDIIGAHVNAGDTPLVAADVGCGTGIFTRLLATSLGPTASVVGVEPNAAMRERASAAAGGRSNLAFRPGIAEALPFASESLALVTAATAAHWFDRVAFYTEAFRCLRPGGVLAIVQNKRRWWDSDFLAAYEAVHERLVPLYRRGTFPDHQGGYSPADFAGELADVACAGEIEHVALRWEDRLSVEAFEALSLSSTISLRAIEAIGQDAFIAEVRRATERHVDPSGALTLPYVTEITTARSVVDR